jgi:transcriptional regulator with XRE-family HTH domain
MGSAVPEEDGLDRFPERLKALLGEREISHRGLARKLGVSKQSVTNWTQGRNEPSLKHLRGIADQLNLPLGELLEGPSTGEPSAASLLQELTSDPVGPAVRSLQLATPDLFDLLTRAERYVRHLDRP